MATRYERLKAAFRERVLPHFPKAERRFKRYFRPSYEILRRTDSDRTLDLDFALLGLKPLSLTEDWYPSEALAKMLLEAGLQINVEPKQKRGSGAEVYDPELVAEPLSKMLNRNVTPENAEEAVKEAQYAYDHSNELLGYPQPFRWLSVWDAIYMTDSGLSVHNISQDHQRFHSGSIDAEYYSGFGCVITDIEPVISMLPAYAAAAAIVADIRDHPIDIITEAIIRTNRVFFSKWGKEIAKISVTITRTGTPAEWMVDSDVY